MITDNIETMFVGCLNEEVVSIDKLNKSALGHSNAGITCGRRSPIRLAYEDDILNKTTQCIDRRKVGAVVNDDDLPLFLA